MKYRVYLEGVLGTVTEPTSGASPASEGGRGEEEGRRGNQEKSGSVGVEWKEESEWQGIVRKCVVRKSLGVSGEEEGVTGGKVAAAGGEEINDCAKEMFEHETFLPTPRPLLS